MIQVQVPIQQIFIYRGITEGDCLVIAVHSGDHYS